MSVMAGVRGGIGSEATTFAGISASNGQHGARRPQACRTADTLIGSSERPSSNPDLVGEMRVILTPVDAEMGRGTDKFKS